MAAEASRTTACFFFQAEDGIRDLYVTGVQTCALPISRPGHRLPGAVDALGRGRYRARLAAYRALVAQSRARRARARLSGRAARSDTGPGRDPRGNIQAAFRVGGTSRSVISVASVQAT